MLQNVAWEDWHQNLLDGTQVKGTTVCVVFPYILKKIKSFLF